MITGKDGVDHINVYSKGETALGRWLSNFARSPILIPVDGLFQSVEGYWYWLRTGDERLRKLWGFEAKRVGRESQEREPAGFQDKIRKAIQIKLESNPEMLEVFRESTLPLEHYYVFSGVKKDAGYKWILEHLEELRRTL